MHQIENDRLQIEIDILLREYEALKEEAVQRLQFFFKFTKFILQEWV